MTDTGALTALLTSALRESVTFRNIRAGAVDSDDVDADGLARDLASRLPSLIEAARREARYSGAIATIENATEQGLVVHLATRATCAEHIDAGDDKATEPLTAAAFPEAARRAAAARFVAEHWRDSYMEEVKAGDMKWGIGTHPLSLVLAALDGETDPRQLGLPESTDDAFRSLLHDSAGAATEEPE